MFVLVFYQRVQAISLDWTFKLERSSNKVLRVEPPHSRLGRAAGFGLGGGTRGVGEMGAPLLYPTRVRCREEPVPV